MLMSIDMFAGYRETFGRMSGCGLRDILYWTFWGEGKMALERIMLTRFRAIGLLFSHTCREQEWSGYVARSADSLFPVGGHPAEYRRTGSAEKQPSIQPPLTAHKERISIVANRTLEKW